MAGSYNHCTTEMGTYRGIGLLENRRDMAEAVEEMFFIIQRMADGNLPAIAAASEEYFKCLRGERPWPDFMKPGVET